MREGTSIEFAAHSPLVDPTVRYIVHSQPLHDRLGRVLTQVAGFALLVMTRGSRVPMLDGPLALAADAFRSTTEEFQALRAPEGTGHHHLHLAEASSAIGRSIELLTLCLRSQADDTARAALSRSLSAAAGHMRAAARLLPGFEMVDLTQSCCGGVCASRPIICSSGPTTN
jgi:hypothetical protein